MKKNLLVTFHPATMKEGAGASQMAELLAALEPLNDTRLIFTMPNADAESAGMWEMVQRFAEAHSNARAVISLGQHRYLSCVAACDGVVGNSSSGLIEVPALKKGTVNVGDRQKGRLRAATVIDCDAERGAITAAIAMLYSSAFRERLREPRNPYGVGGASERILRVLEDVNAAELLNKSFHDLAC